MQLDRLELPFRGAGRVNEITHSAPKDPLWRLAHHKRWYYVSVATESHLFAGSIVDLGYMAKGFIYLADRANARMTFHHEQLWPYARVSPAGASFRSPLLSLAIQRHAEQTLFTARAGALRVQLGLQERTQPFLAATMLPGGATHVTEKTLGLDALGSVGSLELRGCGAVDFSDGYVPRHTRWKWANFSTQSVAMNVTEGFVGTPECFGIVNGQHVLLGEARITMPEDPMQPWLVTTACGKVDLRFKPFALHADSSDLGLIHAKFKQPVGLYEGVVVGQKVHDVVGVCEDQDVLW